MKIKHILKIILLLIVITLAGCGGGGDSSSSTSAAAASTSTTYNAAASEGELLEYTLDETNLTYSYKVTSSAVGINNDTHTGTLVKNADGTYTPSTATSSRVIVLPNKLVVGATKLNINGADKHTVIVGVPTTTNVQFSDIAGTYNYVSLQCLTSACNDSTGDPESAYGTFNVSTSGNWVECTRSNYTAAPSSCAGRDSGTLNSLGSGKFQILSGSTDMGTGMFYHSSSGQKVLIVDLKNFYGNYGRGMIYGVPQKTLTLGASTNGKYYWNSTQGTNGWVNVSGSTYTHDTSASGTITANTPWTGMMDADSGYGILADEGTYMWVPKSLAVDTYMVVGVKK
jgi:hypothetical protein